MNFTEEERELIDTETSKIIFAYKQNDNDHSVAYNNMPARLKNFPDFMQTRVTRAAVFLGIALAKIEKLEKRVEQLENKTRQFNRLYHG